ncbi:RES family NAD+ phosphorylase [Rhodoplanes roseus]|uniref:RES family NAD+ phosphorylase n=1 Tax=Rhodoplanes roseus TaxID=29409 RepID=UPI001FE18D63|nr:RES family NAD+ phosphorylase [Rhodoplanes roseus]
MPPGREPRETLPARLVDWPKAWRIIASRYPPIDLFERLTPDPAVWDVLAALEQATNPRVRDALGEIALVPPQRRVSGPGASFVMAAFTHLNPKGSRFSDGTFGVYYAAASLDTAIAETVHHFGRFAADAGDPLRREDMRVLVGTISHRLDDVAALPEPERGPLLDPESYAASQPFGRARRAAGSDGIVYPSVRHPGGDCVAAFWPDVVGIPVQERHLQYEWDGRRVSRWFDFSRDVWVPL